MILASKLVFSGVYDVYFFISTNVIYLHCHCCYIFIIALDAAVSSLPQRTNTLLFFV